MTIYANGYLDAFRILLNSKSSKEIKNVTTAINNLNKDKLQSQSSLQSILLSAELEGGLKKLACIELRKSILRNGLLIESIKDNLVVLIKNFLGEEVLDKHLVELIKVIFDKSKGNWPQLLEALNSLILESNPVLGYGILMEIIDSIVAYNVISANQLISIYNPNEVEQSQQDEKLVFLKLTGILKIALAFQELGNDDFLTFFNNEILPYLIQQLSTDALKEEDHLVKIKDDLIDLLEIINEPNFLALFSYYTSRINQEFNLNFLLFSIFYKKTLILKNNLLNGLIPLLLNEIKRIIQTTNSEDEADNHLRLLSTISLHVSAGLLFPYIQQYLQDPSSDTVSCMLVLASVVEGCSDYISNEVGVETMCHYFCENVGRHPENLKVILDSLYCLCNEISDFGKCFRQLLPFLCPLLQQQLDPDTFSSLLNVLDVLIESVGVEKDFTQFLPDLMNTFVALLKTCLQRKDESNSVILISCIGSCAFTAKEDFKPYYYGVISLLEEIIQGNVDVELECATLDCVCSVASSCPDLFIHNIKQWTNYAFSKTIPGETLAESGFCYFKTLVKYFKNQITSNEIELMTNLLFQSLALEEEDENAEDFDDMDEEEDENYEPYNAIIQEKEAALDVLGDFYENLGKDFPALDKLASQSMEMLNHNFEGIRRSAVSTCFAIINGNIQVKTADFLNFKNSVIGSCTGLMENDEDLSVVVRCCVELRESLKKVGSEIFEVGMIESVSKSCLIILQNQSACQQADVGETVDVTEYDGLVFSSVIDLIEQMCKVYGENYQEYLEHFWPFIRKFYGDNMAVADRSMTIGFIGEVVHKSTKVELARDFMEVLKGALNDKDDVVLSNSAYSIGKVIENVGFQTLVTSLDVLLEAMKSIVIAREKSLVLLDNVVGCWCRMLKRFHIEGVKPDENLYFAVMELLPLRKDMDEYENVLSTLLLIPQERFKDRIITTCLDAAKRSSREDISKESKQLMQSILSFVSLEDQKIITEFIQ